MEPYKLIGFLIVVLGAQGVPTGFLMAGDTSSAGPKVGKELHATSPATTSSRYMNVEGKLKEIKGDVYILEVASAEQPVQLQVGKDTAFPNGHKEPGQPVQALVSAQDGHALIIR